MAEESPLIEGRNGNDQSNDPTPTLPIGIDTGRIGRPKGSKNKNRPIVLGVKEEPVSRRVPDVDSTESAKFIGEALVSLVELAETLVHNSCEKKIERKRPEKIGEFRQLLESYKLKEKERGLLSDSAAKIAIRHDWMTKFAPEVVLAVTLGQYSLRQLTLMKFVGNVTADKKTDNTSSIPTTASEEKKP